MWLTARLSPQGELPNETSTAADPFHKFSPAAAHRAAREKSAAAGRVPVLCCCAGFLQDRNKSKWLASLADPWVRLVDKFVGEKVTHSCIILVCLITSCSPNMAVADEMSSPSLTDLMRWLYGRWRCW